MPRIPMSGEPRSERLAIFVTVRTRKDLTKAAMVRRTSVNQLINEAIEKNMVEYQDDIQRYNEFFGEE